MSDNCSFHFQNDQLIGLALWDNLLDYDVKTITGDEISQAQRKYFTFAWPLIRLNWDENSNAILQNFWPKNMKGTAIPKMMVIEQHWSEKRADQAEEKG